jgi:hypothetical protein
VVLDRGNAGRSPRGNPILSGSHSVEMDDEVLNPMEVTPRSRESGCVRDGRALGRRQSAQREERVGEAREGPHARDGVCKPLGQETSEGRSPRRHTTVVAG